MVWSPRSGVRPATTVNLLVGEPCFEPPDEIQGSVQGDRR